VRVLVIDNYDSFTYNLVQYLGELGSQLIVFRNDELDRDKIKALKPHRIVISPGPGNPQHARDFGICQWVLQEISRRIPTLGVCLGHQGIAAVFGGRITQAKTIRHGKTSRIFHDGRAIFRGVPNGFLAARYHSLAIDRASLPPVLEISAESEDGEIMGIRHNEYPIEGVQFHPESILTEHGRKLLANFLAQECEPR